MCFDFVTIIKPRKRSLTWRSPWNSRQSMRKLWKNTMLEMKKYEPFFLFFGRIELFFVDESNCSILGILVHGCTYHDLFVCCRSK